jgi:regulatory protein
MKRLRSPTGARRKSGPAQIARTDVDLSTLNDPLIVSALSETPNRSGRYRVAINGVEIGDVTIDFVADAGIREGTTIARLVAVEVMAATQRTAVLDKALDLLAVRARSSRDLGIRLRRAGAQGPDISWAVERLVAQGFVDDAAYARGVARAKALAGGVSRRKVITVLRQKGVAPDVAVAAIDETLSEVDHDEYSAALAAAEKRMRALGSLEPLKRRQRLYAFLARRGYESDVVRRVLAEVLR